MDDQTAPGSARPSRGELAYRILDRLLHALPDLRAWAAIGLFGLVVKIFLMIQDKPTLTDNQGFMFLSQAVIVSGLVSSLLGYLFTARPGGSKAAGGQSGTGAGAAPPAGSMTITPPAQVNLQQPPPPPDPAEELFVQPKA